MGLFSTVQRDEVLFFRFSIYGESPIQIGSSYTGSYDFPRDFFRVGFGWDSILFRYNIILFRRFWSFLVHAKEAFQNGTNPRYAVIEQRLSLGVAPSHVLSEYPSRSNMLKCLSCGGLSAAASPFGLLRSNHPWRDPTRTGAYCESPDDLSRSRRS